MKKFILTAFATLMISSSAFANSTVPTSADKTTSSLINNTVRNLDASIKIDALTKRICVIRVITTYSNGNTTTQVFTYTVDDGEDSTLAQTQCAALKALHIAALGL